MELSYTFNAMFGTFDGSKQKNNIFRKDIVCMLSSDIPIFVIESLNYLANYYEIGIDIRYNKDDYIKGVTKKDENPLTLIMYLDKSMLRNDKFFIERLRGFCKDLPNQIKNVLEDLK